MLSAGSNGSDPKSGGTASVTRAGYRYLIIALLMYLIVGVVNTWTNFATPIAQDLGWNTTVTATNYTIVSLCMGFGAMLGGHLAKRKPMRMVMLLAAVLYGAGYLGSSLTQSNTPFVLYLCYGVCAAGGCGMTMNAMNNCVAQWFPNKVGTVSGIMMLGSGLSSLFLGTATSYLVNGVGWRLAFRIAGVVSFCVLALCSFLMRLPREGEAPARREQPGRQQVGGSREYSPLQMLRRPSFYMFFVWTGLMFGVTVAQTGTARQVADSIQTPTFLATLGIGFIMLFNGVGAIIAGHIYDRLGRKIIMLGQNIGWLVGIFTPLFGDMPIWLLMLIVIVFTVVVTQIVNGQVLAMGLTPIVGPIVCTMILEQGVVGSPTVMLSVMNAAGQVAYLTVSGSVNAAYLLNRDDINSKFIFTKGVVVLVAYTIWQYIVGIALNYLLPGV